RARPALASAGTRVGPDAVAADGRPVRSLSLWWLEGAGRRAGTTARPHRPHARHRHAVAAAPRGDHRVVRARRGTARRAATAIRAATRAGRGGDRDARPYAAQRASPVSTTRYEREETMSAQVQKPAPDFHCQAMVNGQFKDLALCDFRGRWLVLFFYPLDFTFVC